MDAIAVIDDRADMRESVAGLIRLGLEDLELNWDVITDAPLEDIESYLSWVKDNDVRVLVLDEKLSEEIGARGTAVTYSGHEVATLLRDRLPELPQLIITSIKASEELEGAAELDAIVQRDEFNKHSKVYVERMARLGARYVERNETELAELTDLSSKVVSSTASPEDMKRLNAIREKIQFSSGGGDVVTLREWLSEAESVKERLQSALSSLEGKSKE